MKSDHIQSFDTDNESTFALSYSGNPSNSFNLSEVSNFNIKFF